jgi:hypothetical protein
VLFLDESREFRIDAAVQWMKGLWNGVRVLPEQADTQTVAKKQRGDDPVARLQEEAHWSSFTASWSRQTGGGPRWVRRILIAVILLIIVASVIGAIVSIVQGDPIDREFGEASNQLDVAMDRLSELGIACSKEVVGEVDPGGASVGCTTQEGVGLALVAFRDADTRDRVVDGCELVGVPLIVPRSASWVLWLRDESDAGLVRTVLQRGRIAIRPTPACDGYIDLLHPSVSPS